MDIAGRRRRLIVDVPESIAKRALAMVGDYAAYETFSDLVATALENQMLLEGDVAKSSVDGVRGASASSEFREPNGPMDFPNGWHPATPPPQPVHGEGPLSPFTNRLTPLLVPLRCIARYEAETGRPPTWDMLVEVAGPVAREVGLMVRSDDERRGRRGPKRRWTAWPVGADEAQSVSRFRRHFVGRLGRDQDQPPIVALGLAVATPKEVRLTDAGIVFASSPTPMLGEDHGAGPLSVQQQEVLRERLGLMPAEMRRVTAIEDALSKGPATPAEIDEALAALEPEWSGSQIVSLRAALLGRMSDAGMAEFDSELATFQLRSH